MALALAHALELPGKLRLSKEQYLSVQPIYHPGFTIGGMAEPVGLFLTLLLVLLTPYGSTESWLVIGAFVALLTMHAVYWLLTHPVNDFWFEELQPPGLGGAVFNVEPREDPDWTQLRNRWESSHVLRAGLGLGGLALLVFAIAL